MSDEFDDFDDIDNIDIASILDSARFKHNKVMEAEYRSHIVTYRRSLKEAYPDQFNWGIDGPAIIEMAQCLVEVDHYNTLIAEAISAGKPPAGWISGERKKQRDALFKYRKDLILSIESRIKLSGQGKTKPKTTAADDFATQYG